MRAWSLLTDLFNPDQINAELDKKYRDTYVKISIGNSSFYGRYRGFTDEGFYKFKTTSNDDITLVADTDAVISYEQIKLGLYNTIDGAMVVHTLPHRQWKRGLCEKNTAIESLSSNVINGLRGNNFNIYFKDVFETPQLQEELTLAKALTILDTSNTLYTLALNRKWAVLNNIETDDPSVYHLCYYTTIVAKIKNKQILVTNGAFTQEILEAQQVFSGYEVIK